jgi:hypothetical protein
MDIDWKSTGGGGGLVQFFKNQFSALAFRGSYELVII